MNEVRVDSVALFDEVETHTDCTVQILRNSVTGEVSVGWWENHRPPEDVHREEGKDET